MEEAYEHLVAECNRLRGDIEGVKTDVWALPADRSIPSGNAVSVAQYVQREEVLDNIKLAFRHLEDARMRLGKAIQAAGDGVSIYDKKESN